MITCKKYFADKAKNDSSVRNMFSRYGDIAQVNENTYVDCGRSLMNMQ